MIPLNKRFIALLVSLLLGFVSVGCAAEQKPGDIIAERTKIVLDTLVKQRAAFSADSGKLDQFVQSELNTLFDREYSARLVLAMHSRGVDANKITAFADALINTLLRKYGAALLETDPSTDVKVLSETALRNGEMIRVATEVHRRGGAPIPVDYLFRQNNGEWKVFDVIVEGVSYVQTYRTQFDELLRRQTLDQVTDRLQQGQIDVKN
ncbi:MAG: ABC transporter substrate-binding protein [Xanthomonadales bacterium]|nr:ABC transporter substrate-binding protein [Xanthomonadales bacterium]